MWLKRRSLIFVFTVLTSLGCQVPLKPAVVVVATAANAQFAMQDIGNVFEQETGIPVEIVIASSGKLTAQIRQGAPFDLFVSADMKYPLELYSKGFSEDYPAIYAYGKLVLWSRLSSDSLSGSGLQLLLDHSVRKIAIANPITAPYGIAAVEALQYYGIYDTVKDKLVYGESVSQVSQFIISGAVDIGITAKSIVLSPEAKGKGIWEDVEENAYSPIEQGVLILKKKKGKKSEATKIFYHFLLSDKGKKILEEFGYQTKRKS